MNTKRKQLTNKSSLFAFYYYLINTMFLVLWGCERWIVLNDFLSVTCSLA